VAAGLSADLGFAVGAAELDADELAGELDFVSVELPLSPPHATANSASIAMNRWILRTPVTLIKLLMSLLEMRELRLLPVAAQ
tara:strand:- start:46 stop:294 length:249 start_codon:yes stop_codon:yes gene_type:complete